MKMAIPCRPEETKMEETKMEEAKTANQGIDPLEKAKAPVPHVTVKDLHTKGAIGHPIRAVKVAHVLHETDKAADLHTKEVKGAHVQEGPAVLAPVAQANKAAVQAASAAAANVQVALQGTVAAPKTIKNQKPLPEGISAPFGTVTNMTKG